MRVCPRGYCEKEAKEHFSQSPGLKSRVEEALSIIQEALTRFKFVAVGFAGGKDSTVVLHLTLQKALGIPVSFSNTGIEFPETVKFVRDLAQDWDLNYVEHRPDPSRSFFRLMQRYGPYFSMRRFCCYYLKEEPFARYARSLGYSMKDVALVTGRRRQESKARAAHMAPIDRRVRGYRYWIINPLINWSLFDVWRYIYAHRLPFNPLYLRGYKRVGCWGCYACDKKLLGRTHSRFLRTLRKAQALSKGAHARSQKLVTWLPERAELEER